MKDLLLITPPFTQLNTPYPATPYLTGFLRSKNISCAQMDLGIEVILSLFTREHLAKAFELAKSRLPDENCQRIFALQSDYLSTIEEVIAFLQGKNPNLARQIAGENFLPQASRFAELDDLEWAFGTMGQHDKAKHLATLYLEDLSDFLVACLDPHFGFSRYAERLGRSANSFDELYQTLQSDISFIEEITLRLLEQKVRENQPKLVSFSVPFPGNLFSAFRCAQYLKNHFPEIQTAMGGGFPNTELRSVSDPRVFEFFDYITLDDGELPLQLLANRVSAGSSAPNSPLKRTFLLKNGVVIYQNDAPQPDYKQADLPAPDYDDLPLDRYISVIEVANPMHSLWSDGRWNKLTMAHGCYWGKCTFCDISLDYIRLYEPIAAKTLVDRVEELITQTGEKGFHFVDEAAPPALMREFALEILRRGLSITWWTNIRFEKSFSRHLCLLLKASGCIAVSGGLEVASNRLLDLIQKGVTVEQVARVTHNFTEAGIMVHAYLMYGYPTQTVQETVDSLEMVRQMFALGIIQSGFWHQFALTAHSPVGMNPGDYGILPKIPEVTFANNDLQFLDKTGLNHEKFSFGLKKSLFNYMHGICFEYPLQEWFDFRIPRTTIAPDFIELSLEEQEEYLVRPNAKIVWLGNQPITSVFNKAKKGKIRSFLRMEFHDRLGSTEITLEKELGDWLLKILPQISVRTGQSMTFAQVKADFETNLGDFDPFWYSKPMQNLRDAGLLVL
ncbi:MAG: radical SAM protein [Bacteroidia bacterium]|nr:radical SAM protein [Bacteroidia bacterium]